jgi:hypothetical protein
MKWLYISLAALGTVTPIGVLYAVNYDRRAPGAIIDLGLLFFSAGIGIIFVPIGLGLGLALAAIIQFAGKQISSGTGPSRTRPR